MIEIQLFYENPARTSDPYFSLDLDKRSGEVVKVSRIPCVGEFLEIVKGKKSEVFVVIEVAHYTVPSDKEPHEFGGDVVLRRAIRR